MYLKCGLGRMCRNRLIVEFLTDDDVGVGRDDHIIGCLLTGGGVFKVTAYQLYS